MLSSHVGGPSCKGEVAGLGSGQKCLGGSRAGRISSPQPCAKRIVCRRCGDAPMTTEILRANWHLPRARERVHDFQRKTNHVSSDNSPCRDMWNNKHSLAAGTPRNATSRKVNSSLGNTVLSQPPPHTSRTTSASSPRDARSHACTTRARLLMCPTARPPGPQDSLISFSTSCVRRVFRAPTRACLDPFRWHASSDPALRM